MITLVLVPILTILMSGVIASVVTFKLNARLQRRDFMRGRLEELYSSVHKYCNGLRGYFLVYLSMLAERIGINQANDLHIKQIEDSDSANFKNVEMLIGIYFPHLQPEFDALLASRDKLNSIVRQYRGGSDGPELLPSFRSEFSNLDRMEEALKKSLMNEARRFM
jgi:hypothetical protein